MKMDFLRGPDAGTLLVRALRSMAETAGCPMRIESIAGRPWASATFTGMRHRVVFTAWQTPGTVPGVREWLAALPEAAFVLRGHIVADCCIDRVDATGDERRVTLTVLTLAEG